MKVQLPNNRKVQVAFGALIAVLLIVGIIAYRSLAASADSARWAQHTYEVIERLGALRLNVESSESGYREFALTGAGSALERARANAGMADQEQGALQALTADNPSQQARLRTLAELRQRMAQRGESIAGSPQSPVAGGAAALSRSGQDDSPLSAFRVVTHDMDMEERVLLQERNSAALSRYRETRVILIVGSALALLIAALSGWRVARDRMERAKAENGLKSLNRLYAMATGISASMVQVRDRTDLFNRACRTAVEHGEFEMAWIATIDPAEERIVPVAWAGHNESNMAVIRAHFASREGTVHGNTLAARALREGEAMISNDVQTDQSLIFGKMHAESGVRSLAVFPLLISGKPIGVFTLYTSKPEFFDAEGLLLLTELAGNVAFAVDHLERQERLDRLANYDTLTGLANRRSFLERVTRHMLRASNAKHKMAVFLIDLERFKKLNDSLGREVGDALLKQVAEWLTRNLDNADLVARLDADHFAVVLPTVMVEANVSSVLERTIASFMKHEFGLNGAAYRMAAKIGVAVFPDDGTDADALMNNAEAALKKAKASRERYLFYAQKMTETVALSVGIENRLRRALEREEFVLHYQPKVNIVSGQVTGAEALIRWNDPVAGVTPPGRFIPILEETGLIHDVGRWALHKAMEDYQRWRHEGRPAVRISVNVSPLQLRNRNFVEEIRQAVSVASDAGAGLQLEITESVIMQDVNLSIDSLLAIRELGVTIAIDDFGTGFSSLNYLAKIPVDTLKIDRSFVVEMASASGGLTLVSVIINLARALRLNTVAEGVETEEQLRQLRLLGCDEMQGYLFGKPVPVDAFEQHYLAPARGEPSRRAQDAAH